MSGYLTLHCSSCPYWIDNSWDFGCNSHAFNDCPYLYPIKAQSQKPIYAYDGPVLIFDECVEERWKGQTTAVSKRKARSNLTYQWKKEHGYPANAKVYLPGLIITINRKEIDDGD